MAWCGVGSGEVSLPVSSSLSQRASSSAATTVRAGTSKCQRASRSRPPAGKVTRTVHSPLSLRAESQSAAAGSTPRWESRALTRAERVGVVEAPPAAAAQPDPPSQARDILALGKDRSLVATHLLHRPAGAVGDVLRAQTRADHRLDLTWAHATVDLDLELAEPRAVASDRRSQGLVEGDAELPALGIGQQQVLAVLMDTDQPQVAHCLLPYRHIVVDSAITGLAEEVTTPRG